jgi:hypothetical protein
VYNRSLTSRTAVPAADRSASNTSGCGARAAIEAEAGKQAEKAERAAMGCSALSAPDEWLTCPGARKRYKPHLRSH